MRSNFSVVFLTMSGSGEDGARAERIRPADNNIVMEALRGQMQAIMREMTHMRGEMGEMRVERDMNPARCAHDSRFVYGSSTEN